MDKQATNLRGTVYSMHSCRAICSQTVPVRETFKGLPVSGGVVHFFDIEGQPQATRAYTWFSAIDDSDKRRVHAALQLRVTKAPPDSVRATIMAEHRRP